jgi:hypothetical protein
MTTISSSNNNNNVVSILSDPRVSERAAQNKEEASKADDSQESADAAVSEIRSRESIRSEDDAFALASALRQSIRQAPTQAVQAQANQKPDDTQILLA